MRGLVLGIGIVAAVVLGRPAPAAAQWGSATVCDTPYDGGVSGYYGSTCRTTTGYAGWGYGAATVSQYAVGGWWSYPQATAGASYSPWGYGSYQTVSCRAWTVC